MRAASFRARAAVGIIPPCRCLQKAKKLRLMKVLQLLSHAPRCPRECFAVLRAPPCLLSNFQLVS
jgi:hypothetical protein